jgi:hypothetical protein
LLAFRSFGVASYRDKLSVSLYVFVRRFAANVSLGRCLSNKTMRMPNLPWLLAVTWLIISKSLPAECLAIPIALEVLCNARCLTASVIVSLCHASFFALQLTN